MKSDERMIFVDLGGEYAAVPAKESANNRRNMLLLNETGKEIVEGIQSGMETKDIVMHLMDKYDIDENRAKRAVDAVRGKLTQHDII